MESFGVASKQTNRARQTFQRSAEQAQIFNDKKDRLVLPAGVSLDSKPSNGGASRKMETPVITAPGGDLNPLLLESLPPEGAEWPRDARQQWMQILERALDRLYIDKAE